MGQRRNPLRNHLFAPLVCLPPIQVSSLRANHLLNQRNPHRNLQVNRRNQLLNQQVNLHNQRRSHQHSHLVNLPVSLHLRLVSQQVCQPISQVCSPACNLVANQHSNPQHLRANPQVCQLHLPVNLPPFHPRSHLLNRQVNQLPNLC